VRLARTIAVFTSATVLSFALLTTRPLAQTPIAGHYPPGQSGFRGAACPGRGWSYTNFSRFFSNLEVKDQDGNSVESVDEVRYANVSMIGWTSRYQLFGMTYGALAGIPFATGNLTPSSEDVHSTSFGLGDVLITPVSLCRSAGEFDYQFQFTVWTASGRFSPGSPHNRGAGYSSLVYSIGSVWYPGGDRRRWSVSAVARIGQNFEQSGTGIDPGDDVVIDWGIARMFGSQAHPIELGVSGFASWQFTQQSGGSSPAPSEYRYYGVGPEGSLGITNWLTVRLRPQWEFGVRNSVQGNHVWLAFGAQL